MLAKNSSFGVRVTGLTEKTTEKDLVECFSQIGNIVSIHLAKRSEKLEGHIFYATSKEMRAAVSKLHEHELNNKRISVTILVSQPKELYDLYISGHPGDASNEELRSMFTAICDIDCIRITNKGKYCFLQVYGRASCDRAVKTLNGAVTKDGYKLTCELSKKKQTTTNTKELELSVILNSICRASHILPALSDADMHILERSLRTFHLSQIAPSTTEAAIRSYFEQYGEIESAAIIFKETFTSAYGFVVFKSHRTSDTFRNKAISTIFINNTMVKVSSSKPTTSVIETAQAAGLMNYEIQATQLLYSVLSTALDIYERPKSVYLHDPQTGQCFLWNTTEREYARYLEQKIQQQEDEFKQTQKVLTRVERQLRTYSMSGYNQFKNTQRSSRPQLLKKYSPY